MATKTIRVNVHPDNLEEVSFTFKYLENGPLGEYFNFVIEETYLTKEGSIHLDLPEELADFLKKNYSRKRPLSIPLIST